MSQANETNTLTTRSKIRLSSKETKNQDTPIDSHTTDSDELPLEEPPNRIQDSPQSDAHQLGMGPRQNSGVEKKESKIEPGFRTEQQSVTVDSAIPSHSIGLVKSTSEEEPDERVEKSNEMTTECAQQPPLHLESRAFHSHPSTRLRSTSPKIILRDEDNDEEDGDEESGEEPHEPEHSSSSPSKEDSLQTLDQHKNTTIPGASATTATGKPLQVCHNCGISKTPLWRKAGDKNYLCNACGLYLKIHSAPRPEHLKSNEIKSRRRTRRNQSLDQYINDNMDYLMQVKRTSSNPHIAGMHPEQMARYYPAIYASPADYGQVDSNHKRVLIEQQRQVGGQPIGRFYSEQQQSYYGQPYETRQSAILEQVPYPTGVATRLASPSKSSSPAASRSTTEFGMSVESYSRSNSGSHLEEDPVDSLIQLKTALSEQPLQSQQQQQHVSGRQVPPVLLSSHSSESISTTSLVIGDCVIIALPLSPPKSQPVRGGLIDDGLPNYQLKQQYSYHTVAIRGLVWERGQLMISVIGMEMRKCHRAGVELVRDDLILGYELSELVPAACVIGILKFRLPLKELLNVNLNAHANRLACPKCEFQRQLAHRQQQQQQQQYQQYQPARRNPFPNSNGMYDEPDLENVRNGEGGTTLAGRILASPAVATDSIGGKVDGEGGKQISLPSFREMFNGQQPIGRPTTPQVRTDSSSEGPPPPKKRISIEPTTDQNMQSAK